MVLATKEDVKEESIIFNDAWALLKKYYNIDGKDESWNALVEESHQLNAKHNNHPFSTTILVDVINHIERVYKSRGE